MEGLDVFDEVCELFFFCSLWLNHHLGREFIESCIGAAKKEARPSGKFDFGS